MLKFIKMEGPGPPEQLELVLFDVQYSIPLQSYLQYFKDNEFQTDDVDVNIEEYLKLREEIVVFWKMLTQSQRRELIHIYQYIKEIDEIVHRIRHRRH